MMSVTDSRVLDANSEAQGVSVSTLMDNAGAALSDFLLKQFPCKNFIFIVERAIMEEMALLPPSVCLLNVQR